jgi:Protein of unknown function (DUF2917)
MEVHRKSVEMLELEAGEPIRLAADGGLVLTVIVGTVWMTAEGRPQDLFLAAGATLVLDSEANAVVEGLGPARLQLARALPAPARPMAQAADVLARIRHAALRLRMRSHFGAALPAD